MQDATLEPESSNEHKRENIGILSYVPVRFRQLAMYCLIGCTGATLDFLVYTFLVSSVGLYYQTANLLSVTTGIINNFFLNYFFNFKVRGRIWVRLCSFYAVGMLGWALSAGCLWLGIDVLGLNVLISKLISIVFVTILQFLLNKFFTFKTLSKEET